MSRSARRGFGLGLVALTLALAACQRASRAPYLPPPPPRLGLGPVPSGLARVVVDPAQVRWAPLQEGEPSLGLGAGRNLLGLGFGESTLIQQLVLRARWWAGGVSGDWQSTETVLPYTGSVPSPITLAVPSGPNRVFELLGQRTAPGASSQVTVAVAQAMSLAQVRSGELLSLAFNPERAAAARALVAFLKDAGASPAQQELVATTDLTASLVALVHEATGYQEGSNTYQKVNPVAFRGEALGQQLLVDGLPLLNGTLAMGSLLGTEGWAKMRVRAYQPTDFESDLPLGTDVEAKLFDLSTGGGKMLDAKGEAFWAKVPPGDHWLRFQSPNGEQWFKVVLGEGQERLQMAFSALAQHRLGPQHLLVDEPLPVQLMGLVPSHSVDLPGVVYHRAKQASGAGEVGWVGFTQGLEGGRPMGGGLLGGPEDRPGGVAWGFSSGGVRLAAPFLNASTPTLKLQEGGFTSGMNPIDQLGLGVVDGLRLQVHADEAKGNEALAWVEQGALRVVGSNGADALGSPLVLEASGVQWVSLSGLGSSLRAVWATTGGALRTQRLSLAANGTLSTTSPVLEVGGPPGLKARPHYLAYPNAQGLLAYELRSAAGASPRLTLLALSPTQDDWASGTSGQPFLSVGEQQWPHLLLHDARSGRMGLHYTEAGGPTGHRLRFGIVEPDALASSGFAWVHGPHTVAETSLAETQALATWVSDLHAYLHVWRPSSGALRSRLQLVPPPPAL